MRLYVVNEIKEQDLERITDALEQRGMAASVERLYWLDVPEELLSPEQREHLESCGPFSMGLEAIDEFGQAGRAPGCEGRMLALEMLVRSRNKLRCSCIAYATPEQRAYAIEFLDGLFRELDIPV